MYRYLSLFFALISLGACAQSTQSAVRTDLNVEEVSTLIKSEKEVVLIDVRTPDEFNGGHIKGALHMNIYDADFEARLKELDRDKEYVIYCRSGGRSGKASDKMENLGFTNIHNMKGGMMAWDRAGFPSKK